MIAKEPDITIIICARNDSKNLKDALRSLAKQKRAGEIEYEIIVVDNNSKDKTKEIVHSDMQEFSGNLRYLFEARKGKPYAMNTGIREARGKVIAFVDSDCVVDENYVFYLHQSFSEYSDEIGMVGGKVEPMWMTPKKPKWLKDFRMGTLGGFRLWRQRIYFKKFKKAIFW